MIIQEQRLAQIKTQISFLKDEEKALEQEIMQRTSSFKDKLRIWFWSSNKYEEPWLIEEYQYPHTHKYFYKMDMDRYRYYNIANWFQDEIVKYLKDDIELNATVKNVLQECIEKNLGGFTCDW